MHLNLIACQWHCDSETRNRIYSNISLDIAISTDYAGDNIWNFFFLFEVIHLFERSNWSWEIEKSFEDESRMSRIQNTQSNLKNRKRKRKCSQISRKHTMRSSSFYGIPYEIRFDIAISVFFLFVLLVIIIYFLLRYSQCSIVNNRRHISAALNETSWKRLTFFSSSWKCGTWASSKWKYTWSNEMRRIKLSKIIK